MIPENTKHNTSTLRIGFDAKRAFSNFTGLGNYARSTLKAITKYYTHNEYYLYTPRIPTKKQLDALELAANTDYHIRTPKPWFYKKYSSLWRSYGIMHDLLKDKLDIYHGLSHELPIGISKIKTIVTIHDLIFLRYPNFYRFIDRNIYTLKFKYACKKANHIIAISEQTKKDIIHFFNIDEKKITIINPSVSPIFQKKYTQEEKDKVRKNYDLPESFLLNVGTIESRKNAALIIHALKQSTSTIPLIIIGKKTSYIENLKTTINDYQLKNRVKFIHDVNFTDLPLIYQMANIFIYPSFFEGFGIPIIEALHSGTPTIAAKGSCLEEAGGPDSLYIDPYNETELANAIDRVLSDTGLHQKMVNKGHEYAQRFNEDVIAEKLMNVYLHTINTLN